MKITISKSGTESIRIDHDGSITINVDGSFTIDGTFVRLEADDKSKDLNQPKKKAVEPKADVSALDGINKQVSVTKKDRITVPNALEKVNEYVLPKKEGGIRFPIGQTTDQQFQSIHQLSQSEVASNKEAKVSLAEDTQTVLPPYHHVDTEDIVSDAEWLEEHNKKWAKTNAMVDAYLKGGMPAVAEIQIDGQAQLEEVPSSKPEDHIKKEDWVIISDTTGKEDKLFLSKSAMNLMELSALNKMIQELSTQARFSTYNFTPLFAPNGYIDTRMQEAELTAHWVTNTDGSRELVYVDSNIKKLTKDQLDELLGDLYIKLYDYADTLKNENDREARFAEGYADIKHLERTWFHNQPHTSILDINPLPEKLAQHSLIDQPWSNKELFKNPVYKQDNPAMRDVNKVLNTYGVTE